MEGSLCFNPATGCNNGTLTLPILEYDHSSGDCAITGGYRYRGTQIPQLYGIYLYADYCTGRIWGASQGPTGSWSTTQLLDTSLAISTLGEDRDGELYVAHYSSPGGVIYRVMNGTTTAPDITVSPLSLAFGNVAVRRSSILEVVTVKNDGTANLTIGTVTLGGANPNQFRKRPADDVCSGKTLAPAQSCTVGVRFRPTSAGAKSATLNISSNDPDENLVTVALSGTGT